MSLGTKLAVIAGVLLIAAASGIRFLTQTPAEEAERYPAPESTASLLGEQPAPRVRASVDAAAPRDRDVPDFFVPPEPVLPAGAAWQVRGRVAGVESGHPVLTVSAEMTAPPRLDPERVSLWDLHRQNRAGAGAAVPLALQAVPVEADGSFRVDVDALLAEQPACELVLRIDDPWYLPASLQLPMPELERQRLQEPDAELVLAAAPCGALSGRVRDSGGPVSGALVAVFALEKGLPAETPRDLTSSDAQGCFRLRSDVEGDCLVVAVAPKLLPAALPATLHRGEDRALAPLVLASGDVVSGKVVDTETGQGLPGAPLLLTREEGGLVLHVGNVELVLEDDTLLRTQARAFADDAGRYQFSGLQPGPYRVELLASPSLVERARSVSSRVTSPARDVDFTVSATLLVVEVWSGGLPLDGAEVCVRDIRGGSESATAREGVAALLLPPERVYEVSVSAEHCKAQVLRGALMRSGTVVQRTLQLDIEGATSTLVAELRTEGGGSLERALFTFVPEGEAARGAPRTVAAEGPRFVLAGLAPGAYHLSIQPLGSGREDALEPLFAPIETSVELLAGSIVERSVVLSGGGRLRIAARDSTGACLEARCTVWDGGGQRLDARFSAPGDVGWTRTRPEVLFAQPSTIQRVLPPGDYELRLAARGFGLRTVRARVEPGQTTDVDAVLDPD